MKGQIYQKLHESCDFMIKELDPYQLRNAHCFFLILTAPLSALTTVACHCSVVLALLFVGLRARTMNQHRALGEEERMRKGIGPDLGHRRGTLIIVPEQQISCLGR